MELIGKKEKVPSESWMKVAGFAIIIFHFDVHMKRMAIVVSTSVIVWLLRNPQINNSTEK
jgi:hypothetical protein